MAYDKIGQAVLRLKAIYKELQDDEEDQVCVCVCVSAPEAINN